MALLPCAAVFLFLHGRVFLSGRIYFHDDLSITTHPWARFAADALQGGRLPLWDPYDSFGLPFIGSMQFGTFHPAALAFYLFPYGTALGCFLSFVFAFAAVGAYLLLRRLGLSRAAAGGGALLFSCGGYLHGHAQFPFHVATLAHLPWLALLAGEALVGPLAFAQAFWAGYPPFFVWVALPCALARGRAGLRALALGVLLCAQVWLPGLELFHSSDRRGGNPAGQTAYSLAPADLAGVVRPALIRVFAAAPAASPGVSEFSWDGPEGRRRFRFPSLPDDGLRGPWGIKLTYMKCFYLGAVGFALALAGLAALGRRRPAAAAAAAATAAAGLFLALGENFGPAAFLWRHAPFLRLLREPNRLTWLAAVAGAYLAAQGLDALGRRWGRRARAAALLLAAAELAVLGAGLFPSVPGDFYREKGPLFDFLQARLDGRRYLQTPDVYLWYDPLPSPEPEGYGDFRMAMFHAFAQRGHFTESLSYRLSHIQSPGYLAMLPAGSRREIEELRRRAADGAGLSDALKRACARYVLEPDRRLPEGDGLRYVGTRYWHIYEATGSDSCAYWRPAGQDEEAGGVPWRHERPREDRVRVAGEAAAPGTLFLSELRYPGWEAYVNGGRVESAPASGAFTALPVPAGKSEVFWIYRPWSWPIGLLASLLTAIMLVSDARQVNKVNEVNA